MSVGVKIKGHSVSGLDDGETAGWLWAGFLQTETTQRMRERVKTCFDKRLYTNISRVLPNIIVQVVW